MNPLVTPSWLATRLDDPNTIVLDATLAPPGSTADPHANFLAQHIPGARFFDTEALSDHATTLPHMLPSADSFAAAMTALGVSDTADIIIYEQTGVFSAPRAWWTLRTFGAPNVQILDGGLQAWLAAKLPTESSLPTESGLALRRHPRAEDEGPPHSAKTATKPTFHATFNPQTVVDFPHLQHLLQQNAQILDARSAARFHGTAPEPRPNLPSGHMPGALNLPFTHLVADGRLKPAAELRTLFTSADIDLDRPVTTTCGSGVTAAVLLLGLHIAGATDLTLYDGSWADYAQHPQATILTD